MPIGGKGRAWQILADGFPPTLVTNADETALKPSETPNATGLDLDEESFLKKNTTTPTTNTRVVKTYSTVADGGGTTADYEWHYNRLWRTSGTDPGELIFGAPAQKGLYLPQNGGSIEFRDDTTAMLKMMPIGQSGLIVMKSTGSYIITNANSLSGQFETTEFIEEAKISTATHCIELDGVVYFCNSDGLFSIELNGNVQELSFPVRGDVTAAVVTADYKNKYIKVAATTPYVYDVNTKRWFKYTGASTSTFTYETRRMQSLDRAGVEQPFSVDRVAFQVLWTSGTAEGTLVQLPFQTQVEDREWSATQNLQAVYDRGQQAQLQTTLAQPDTGRNFKLKLTDIPSELSVIRIWVFTDMQVPEARDT